MTGTSKPEPAPAWTPGPWQTIMHNGSPREERQFADATGRPLGICHPHARGDQPSMVEAKANARLVATAPELAAFVEKVRATIAPAVPGPAGDDYLNEGGHDAIAALVPEAEALLAKARGI